MAARAEVGVDTDRPVRETGPTNAVMLFRLAGSTMLCEWEPKREKPARLSDRYHGIATIRVGGRGETHLRVCRECAGSEALRHRPQQPV